MSSSVSFQALGTTAVLCVVDPEGLEPARAELRRELDEIDRACSRFRPDSELSRLNASSSRPVPVGERLLEAVRTALRAAEASDGLVDPTVGRALRTLGYDRTFLLVRRREPGTCRPSVARVPGWHRVELDEEQRTIRLPPGTELDLGATAKALAADRAARAAGEAAGCGVLVSLGGDIAVAGEPPFDGWPVQIGEDHAAATPTGPTVAVSGGGLATSSTTVRRWRAGATTLHHIVDPRTGASAITPWRTVTVAAASCVDANVASTAAVVLGHEAPGWLSEHGLPARLVSLGGSTTCVAGWPEEQG